MKIKGAAAVAENLKSAEPFNQDRITANSPTTVKERRRRRCGAWLVAFLAALILVVWWCEIPRLWLRSFAEKALRQYDAQVALSWIDRAVRYYPQDTDFHVLAARANLQLNMNIAATEWLDRAQVLGALPEELKHYRLMSDAQRGNERAAEQLLGDAGVALEAYEALIRASEYGNKWQRANLILEQLEQLSASSFIVLYHRGRIHEFSERYEEASAFYFEAFRQNPRLFRAAFRAGMCYYNLRDFDRSEMMFGKVQSGVYRDLFAIERANCLWEKNAIEQAARVIEPVLDITPPHLNTLYLQLDEFVDSDRAALVAARIEDAQGNSQRAVLLLQRVLAFNNRDFDARGLLIKNLRALGRIADANEVTAIQSQMVARRQRCRQLRQELELNPRDIARHCELAELYWLAESEAEAMLAISEILELEPTCERALQLQEKILSSRSGRHLPRSSAKHP